MLTVAEQSDVWPRKSRVSSQSRVCTRHSFTSLKPTHHMLPSSTVQCVNHMRIFLAQRVSLAIRNFAPGGPPSRDQNKLKAGLPSSDINWQIPSSSAALTSMHSTWCRTRAVSYGT